MPVSQDLARLARRFAATDPELSSAQLKSTRFAYLASPRRLVVLVPPEDKAPDWALVYGLAERHGRRLTLVLPTGGEFATAQRAPWLTDEARPEVWTHDGQDFQPLRLTTREQTIAIVRTWANKKGGSEAELDQASRPLHLGDRKAAVQELATWATEHPRLDAAHRPGQRSWHAMGKRVLTFETTPGGGLRITAGIQDKGKIHHQVVTLEKRGTLSPEEMQELQARVEQSIKTRLDPSAEYPPDEHWLQAVLRRDPSLVGVEAPALREVPAWRPTGDRNVFSRGYIDLLGLDGQGDVRIVEAKIAKSTDEMTLFQGIDYVVWAHAYADALRRKLSAPTKAAFHLHFVVGAMGASPGLLHKRIAQYADALDTTDRRIRYHFHVVSGWETWTPDPRRALATEPWPRNTLPGQG